MTLIEPLLRRELVLVTGKGGVGKTLLTAVIGVALARRGRRVLAVEVDPRENLHQMLDVPPSGGEIVATPHGVAIQNLQPRDVVDAIVRERVKLGFVVRRVLSSAVYQSFTEGAPGLKEMAILAHAAMLVRGASAGWDPRTGRGLGKPQFDTVVIDAPATGHGLSLLRAPGLVAEAIKGGPFGDLAGELARFVDDAATTGVVIVTQAEELPVEEALDTRRALAELGRQPDLLVVNGVYPPAPEGIPASADAWLAPAASRELPLGDDALFALWRDRRAVNSLELARLTADWPEPWVELPLLPLPPGPELVHELLTRLDPGQSPGHQPAERAGKGRSR
jgi:anion-transporting  ArsA/GET3 family ATPase